MALNLARNSRVFFTTNVDSAGKIQSTGFSDKLYELQVLDGFTFSQNTTQDTVTLSEAGGNPVRGQRTFNTSLAPADFSMSTYIRPFNATTSITAEEDVLWNALLGSKAISAANTISLTGTISGATYAFSAGTGTVTISGTSLGATGLTAGDIVVIGGLSSSDTTDTKILNSSATVVTVSTSAITLRLIAPKTAGGTITITTPTAVKFYKSAWATVLSTASYVSTGASNLNQLQTFGMIFVVDNVIYTLDNCAMTQVTIDFGLDGIATASWTGQGTQLNESAITLSTLTGATRAKNVTAPFITNKLSTVDLVLKKTLGSITITDATSYKTYAVALTGGSVTINNNINYITPANLATVNVAQTYYTGTRAITGTLNAYLKTGNASGSENTGEVLKDMLTAITSSTLSSTAIEPMFGLVLAIGGKSNGTRVELDMQSVSLSVPTVDVQQVISTAINFTAQGYTPSATAPVFDVQAPNELAVRYYAA